MGGNHSKAKNSKHRPTSEEPNSHVEADHTPSTENTSAATPTLSTSTSTTSEGAEANDGIHDTEHDAVSGGSETEPGDGESTTPAPPPPPPPPPVPKSSASTTSSKSAGSRGKGKTAEEKMALYQSHANKLRMGSVGSPYMLTPHTPATWNALVITDTHFGETFVHTFTNMKLKDKSYFSRSNQDKMFETLGRVITSVSPSEIIILGDVFHSVSQKEADPVWCLSIIEKFLSFGLHATIIGGNHDRWMFEKWGDQWQKKHPKHLKVVREKLMLAQDRAETHKFYFTHDGGTALWLSPLQEVPFVLGQRAAQGLQAGDCLCTGHVHRTHDMMEAHGCASLGSCTGSGSSFHYAVFTEAQQEPASLEPGSAGRATPQQGLLTIKFYTA